MEIYVYDANTNTITTCLVSRVECEGQWLFFMFNGEERQFFQGGGSRIKPLDTSCKCEDYNYLVSTNKNDLLNIRDFVKHKMYKLAREINATIFN